MTAAGEPVDNAREPLSGAAVAADESERERFAFDWGDLPLVTPEVPGSGGVIRTAPEDFRVTELPAYLPEGSGSHRYLLIEKRDLTTRDLVQALRRAGVEQSSIGVAGLKDKAAVTVQWLSLPKRYGEAVNELLALPGVRLLEESYHRNKLGIGHLRGNRFEVTVQGVDDGAALRAGAVLDRLAASGSPNWFGPQRFGRFGGNAYDGLRVVRGERVPGGHYLQRFFVAALQSLLFNAMLAERVERGWYTTVVNGDWARKHDTGGTFLVTDEAAEAPRAERLEISATLPLHGRKVKPSEGAAGAVESLVLERYGLRWAQFGSRRGDRRSTRVVLSGTSVRQVGTALTLTFDLPKGAYATAVLREVMKVDVDAPFEAPIEAAGGGDGFAAGDGEDAD
ncbi:MAG: tRNA pseudouridine(13) synthase TruD [Trueperaceae bacterium]|nr:tRNA pseudouridine(13) synthase TruD [Trueperaceae bacterium]